MTFVLAYADAYPPRSLEDTAAAIANRFPVDTAAPFTPSSTGGGFDHATTAQTTTIPLALSLGLSATGSTVADLIAASTKIQDYVNALDGLVNRMVYILEANGMTS